MTPRPARPTRTYTLFPCTSLVLAVEDGYLPENGLLDRPVLCCRGQFDDVIPRHQFEQAEAYLSGPSGGRATFIPYEGGHELPLPIKAAVQGWLGAESR